MMKEPEDDTEEYENKALRKKHRMRGKCRETNHIEFKKMNMKK